MIIVIRGEWRKSEGMKDWFKRIVYNIMLEGLM
jgi:hypothetical protein